MSAVIISYLPTVLVALVLLGIVYLAVNTIRKDRKKGKSCGCGGSCSGCAGSALCHSETRKSR